MIAPIKGFSRLSKDEKIAWIAEQYTADPEQTRAILKRYWHTDNEVQQLHDEFIENTLTNYYMPFSIAPNFLINNKMYAIPMALEESSVVAAASKAAKFWLHRGGFKATVLGTEKIGQVHFLYRGDFGKLEHFIDRIKPKLLSQAAPLTRTMENRGGGVLGIELRNKSDRMAHYYQLHCTFDTQDAMGANFINAILEQFAKTLKEEVDQSGEFTATEKNLEIIMSILSNYVPGCMVRAEVSCPVAEMTDDPNLEGSELARKIVQAVAIAKVEPFRAVTHNKGIMNGVDAVVVATGNDFRAVEAGVHAYAASTGSYTSLSHATIENGEFRFWTDLPLALGTVGGLTRLHPLVKLSLEILQNPTSKELMQVVAVAGLAQNFAALRSLVTTGIQQGHMKMHLLNILNQVGATPSEKENLIHYFKKRTVTHTAVVEAFHSLRGD